MPPADYRITNKDALYRKFVDEGWREKLAPYRYETWPATKRKKIEKWWDGEDIRAFLLTYSNPTGNSTVVRQLRDGDVMYYVP